MKLSSKIYKNYKKYPEKVVQFGEGNFLRAFVDWMINEMNEKGVFNGSVVVVQPIQNGLVDILNEQDGLYTLILQGIKDGKAERVHKIMNSISRGIDPYRDYESFLKVSESDSIRFVVSNTTEAGIAFDESDRFDITPHNSFPAKLTAFMYRRYKHFNGRSDRGLIVIPCELIDKNGLKLKEMILKYADFWNLEKGFVDWVENDNVFCSTLVDRIVTGYPREDIDKIQDEIGYEDSLVDVGEIFHLWVIEGPKWIEEEFPASKIGLNVKFVDDITPYRDRKVRILNGMHTTMVPVAYLYGIDTVKEAVEDEVVGKFIRDAAYEEIMPTLDLPEDEIKEFVKEVFDRFKNPYVKHYLTSIALNAMSKYETRVLPSLLEYVKRFGKLPKKLVFSLASYMEFYKGNRGSETIPLSDEPEILEMYQNLWKNFDGSYDGIKYIVTRVLEYDKVWKMNLNEVKGLNDAVTEYLYLIEKNGIKESLKEVLK
ncbi:MAG: tagaturonate reductase [Thermoanaerobacterium sp.]|nr:tagaturonate reductase [Thermoanaerobacterium sp.]